MLYRIVKFLLLSELVDVKSQMCIRDRSRTPPFLSHIRFKMIQIGDVVVSLDVFQEKFLCDLGACKGACCIEGDAGAPVELDEVMAVSYTHLAHNNPFSAGMLDKIR